MLNIFAEKAAEDFGASRKLTIGVLLLSLLVIGLNWKYFYNLATGPYAAAEVNLSEPGPVEWVTVEGTFLKVGSKNTAVLKQDTGHEVGGYYVTPVNGELLLVYADSDFDQESASGRLEEVSQELRDAGLASDNMLPVMLDAYVSYPTSFSLFLIIAVAAFLIALIVLIMQIKRGDDYAKHPAIKKLGSTREEALAIAAEIEREMQASPDFDKNMPVYCSNRWVVIMSGGLKIYPRDELIAYGLKGDKGSQQLELFRFGELVSDSIIGKEAVVLGIHTRLRAAMPEKEVHDVKGYSKAWNHKDPVTAVEFNAARGEVAT